MSTSERRARSAPPPGQAALEANEEAEVSLVPRKDRRRDKAETKAEPQEPIPEEELEEVLEEEPPASSSARVSAPPRVPDEHYISEARRILDQPHPEVPEEIAAAAADAPAEESGNETEVEWEDSLSSYSSYEVCEIPDLETARREAEAVAAQTKWLEQRRLQAPPLYAAGVAGSTARSSADSKGPAVALLQQSLQQTANVGVAQEQVPPLQSAGTPAGSSKPVNHIDVLKSVKQPQSLKDQDQWERFSFQVETYLALLRENFPADLDNARKLTSFVDPVDMTDEAKSRGRQLFAAELVDSRIGSGK